MTYTVKQGDSLSKISLAFFGTIDFWPAIAELNNITNPDLIMPGMVLTIPDKLEPLTENTTPMQEENNIGLKIITWSGIGLLLAGVAAVFVINKKDKKQKKDK